MLTTVVVMEARLAVHVDLPVDLLVQVIAHVGIVAAAVRVRRVVVDVVVERVVEEVVLIANAANFVLHALVDVVNVVRAVHAVRIVQVAANVVTAPVVSAVVAAKGRLVVVDVVMGLAVEEAVPIANAA